MWLNPHGSSISIISNSVKTENVSVSLNTISLRIPGIESYEGNSERASGREPESESDPDTGGRVGRFDTRGVETTHPPTGTESVSPSEKLKSRESG